MVSLWPFKGDETASFEKTLSSLTDKISKTSSKRDRLRTRSRRIKALWTIYTSFAYLLYIIITFLVTGRANWGYTEYGVSSGAPVLIYALRLAINSYYQYRLTNAENHLKELYAQREEAIEKFKTATKYNTTQQLLEKYGVTPGEQQKSTNSTSPTDSHDSRDVLANSLPAQDTLRQRGRTSVPPPPTANIQRPVGESMTPSPSNITMQPDDGDRELAISDAKQGQAKLREDSSAIFAPNAFPTSEQYSAESASGAHWYDRILDLLLGEDETRAINRLALICSRCRLVNGQAPPGVRQLEEVGPWKCLGCGELNNPEREVEKLLQRVSSEVGKVENPPISPQSGSTSEKGDL